MKTNGYMDRALRARDPRYARILGKLGYATRDLKADAAAPIGGLTPTAAIVDELAELRQAYQTKFGKRPYHG